MRNEEELREMFFAHASGSISNSFRREEISIRPGREKKIPPETDNMKRVDHTYFLFSLSSPSPRTKDQHQEEEEARFFSGTANKMRPHFGETERQ